MSNLYHYTPQIGENFDNLYNIDNQSSNNISVFQDNEYVQGNVTAKLPQQIGDDPNSWIYTWGAFDEQDNPSSIGVSFTEEAFDDMFVVSESEDEFPRLVPHLGTRDFQLPEVNFWEPMITQNFLEQLASSANDSEETFKQTFEIERPTRFMEEGFYPLEYTIAFTPGEEGEQGEYTISLDKLTFEEADIQMQTDLGNDAPSSLSAEDQLEIAKLLSEYDVAIDNGDLEGTVGSFTTDGELNAPFGSGEGVEGLTQFHQQLFDSGFDEGARHLTGNIILDGDSNTDIATGFSYLVIFEGDDQPGVIATATQTDTYRRENGEWKIENRQIEVDSGFLEADINGDDLILGTPEHDILNGFQGNDRIFGLAGDDLISGGEGDDVLQGDAGSDQLFGNIGQDILSGGRGVDRLTGSEDSDIFIIQPQGMSGEENYDLVNDFELGIDVLALDEVEFSQLSILQEGNNTNIWDANNNELLSVLTSTQASEITADVFINWSY